MQIERERLLQRSLDASTLLQFDFLLLTDGRVGSCSWLRFVNVNGVCF